MNEGFLRHYADELQALRGRAARFARAYPKIAGRLRLSPETSDDPHVERLIQSFAFVAARTRQKLDDELPELTDALLETLYPHYLAPVPPATLVELSPRPGLEERQIVARHTEIVTEAIEGEACRFRTARAVEIAPIRIARAQLGGHPVAAPRRAAWEAVSCLRFDIAQTGGEAPLSQVAPERLRVHLRGSWREAVALHELIAQGCIGIAVAAHADDAAARFVSAERIRPVGFEADEAMLPHTPSSAPGYRVLSEFFALPEAFLGFEIDGLTWPDAREASVFLYLARGAGELERRVSAASFALHVTPAINLFSQRAEPVRLDATVGEQPLVPDARRNAEREIHSVARVEVSENGRTREAQPFFSERGGEPGALMWTMRRVEAEDGSTDATIAFVDAGGRPLAPQNGVAGVDTLCFNRDLATRLPFAEGRPRLSLARAHEAVGAMAFLLPPTPTLRPGGSGGAGGHEAETGRAWRLISHLTLNHLSLGDEGGGALRAILRLYALRDTTETRVMVQALRSVSTKPGTARLAGGVVVSGTDVEIVFDAARIDRASAHLFASVLDRFLGLYAAINSFTRLTARLSDVAEPLGRWPARAGQGPLL